MAVFRVSKTKDYTVMSNHHLRNPVLSMKAKGLLSLMLSLPENWDYTLHGLSTISADGLSSIRAAVGELEEAGYLKRRRLRNAKGQLTETEYTILEQPEIPVKAPICENPILENPKLENPMLGLPMLENRTQLNTKESNTKLSNTDLSNINPSIHRGAPPSGKIQSPGGSDMIDGMESYRRIIHKNIDYALLTIQYDPERIDQLVQLMLDAICSPNATIRIERADYPTEAVRDRFLKLEYQHIEYVLDCIDRSASKIQNIRAYLLTALYNSLVTVDSYYHAAVRHDML